MSSSRPNRRDILKVLGGVTAGAGLLDTPFGLLLEILTRGVYGQALAAEAGVNPRTWIDLRFEGAPPRWVYDLFLDPYKATGTFVPSTGFGNRFVGNGTIYNEVQYSTILRNGINVPWIWQFPVPTANGGTRPMTDLLPYMLQLRGVTTSTPDHNASMALHYRPLGAKQSVTALSGDNSKLPLPAVFYAINNFQFGSLASKSPVMADGANLISSLLAPFISSSSASFKSGRTALNTYLTAARSALVTEAGARNPLNAVSAQAQKDAYDLFNRSFGDISVVWNTLLAKYTALINQAIDPSTPLAGINDKPVGVSGTRTAAYEYNGTPLTNADLRTIIQPSTATKPTSISNMAASFAIAEFVATRDLSTSMSLGMGTFNGLNINGVSTVHNRDEHFTGKFASILINSYWARAHAACLLELIDRLGTKWNETIINVSGEFNRSPRTDGSGSDHNYQGANYTFYSGAIKGPAVVGNIKKSTGNAGYTGTWGFGAPIDELSSQQLTLGHGAATIATMLRVPSPITAVSGVVSETAGEIKPIIPNGKNV